MSLLQIFGDANARAVKRLEPLVLRINALEEEVVKLSDAELAEQTAEFRKRLKDGETLDDLLPETFAVVREAAKRTLGQRHYDVQLLGGIVLHQGKIAEMKTGEGKTLVATSPAYLNALSGKGVHLVTVNDYLAKRDAVWMGQVYAALGMTVGCSTQQGSFVYDPMHRGAESSKIQDTNSKQISNSKSQSLNDETDKERDTKGSFKVEEEFLRPASKREAYACDILYGTNNEYGFDYLRDNLTTSLEQTAQRDHAFAIVDEVDSILIDEARTPLIISAPDVDAPQYYQTFSRLAPRLKEEEDYNLDEKRRAVLVTEEGVKKVEGWTGVKDLYGEGLRLVHYLEQALRAQVLYQRDRDYIVRNGEVIIVDEFTGRLMPGRRWSDGLHQAVEAKEGVKVQSESRTLATITFQNYFRLYDKLAGMTGTASTSAEEFHKVYELEVMAIPTAKPMIRRDESDLIFRTEAGKWKALIAQVKECHERGQPVLIGTTSIAKNELVSAMLQREGIVHELLNAKQHEREGAIIAQAGRKSAVTVATNMAGRGVDIILGGNPPLPDEANKVREVGGLAVLGTERHEARRIDNQLRGRSGRQGDPGLSQFFLSLDDDLLRVFGGDKLKTLMGRLDMPEDQPIASGIVTKAVASAQSRIEGQNFDARKHLLEFDDVVNKHRETVYRRRRAILEGSEDRETIEKLFEEEVEVYALVHLGSEYPNEWNVEEFTENLKAVIPCPPDTHQKLLAIAERGEVEGFSPEDAVSVEALRDSDSRRHAIIAWALKAFHSVLAKRREELGDKAFLLEQQVLLRSFDLLWMEHLETMEALRDAVRLRAFGQREPLVEYKVESRKMFKQLEAAIRSRAVQMFFRAQIHVHAAEQQTSRSGNWQTSKPAEQQIGRSENQQISRSNESANRPVSQSAKVGRNDPCPCGSGKKYKKCGMINAPHHRG